MIVLCQQKIGSWVLINQNRWFLALPEAMSFVTMMVLLFTVKVAQLIQVGKSSQIPNVWSMVHFPMKS